MSKLSIDTSLIIEMYQQGKSASAIAREFGCSVNTITRQLRQAGIEIRPSRSYIIGRRHTEETKQKIARGVAEGMRRNGRVLRRVVPCEFCGKPVEKYNKELKRHKHHFCTHECYSKWKTNIRGQEHPLYKKKNTTCPQCGKVFEVHAYRLEERESVFCSKQCHNDWMYENQRGENNPNWRGGRVKYPGRSDSVRDYRNLRETVFKRDGFKCKICGSATDLHIHHIKSWAEYPDLRYDPDNCITVCKECHYSLEKKESLRR